MFETEKKCYYDVLIISYCVLVLTMPIFFVLKMTTAYYVCCIFHKVLQTTFIMEAKNMSPDLIAPLLLAYRLQKNIGR